MLDQRCSSSGRFIITADICTEKPPRAQVFCILLGNGQSGVATRGDTGEAQEKKFIVLTHARETVTVHREGDTWEGAPGKLAQPSK